MTRTLLCLAAATFLAVADWRRPPRERIGPSRSTMLTPIGPACPSSTATAATTPAAPTSATPRSPTTTTISTSAIRFPTTIRMQTYIALDIDSNTATGYDIFGLGLIGSEAGWQNDFAFAQATGVFNSGGLSGDYFGGGHALLSPFADATTNRELAISLDAAVRRRQLPRFPDDTFTILFWTDNGLDVSAPSTTRWPPCRSPRHWP